MIRKYQNFIYNNYKITEDDSKIYFLYNFEIQGLAEFNHKIEILKKDFKWKNLKSKILENIVFNLGMVEAISYFKATCSPNFQIKCGYLDEEQKLWFRKLYYLGLGEFRYRNNIEISEEDFVQFENLGEKIEYNNEPQELNGILIPIGGGKDSCVTTEILKDKFDNINLFRIRN